MIDGVNGELTSVASRATDDGFGVYVEKSCNVTLSKLCNDSGSFIVVAKGPSIKLGFG